LTVRDLVRLWTWTQHLGLTLVGLTPRRNAAGQVVAMDVQPGYYASGHAGGDELREFVRRIAPKTLIPIHTQATHLWPEMLAGQRIHVVTSQYALPVSI
jgi:mRNA degradation ribonuclease J1/J2